MYIFSINSKGKRLNNKYLIIMLTDLCIEDLLGKDKKLTFLVGAGCSVDSPSNQPAGRKMMDAMIKFACPESEFEKISKLEELRFEQLVEFIRDYFDKDLKIIDFYGLCDKPNLQHFFLAEMIKNGNYVITTNFDFLLEHALLSLGVPKKFVLTVITKEDFEKFNDPEENFKNGKKPLYKIHGSTKNIITGENTKDSLIATIQAFGSNKEGLNVFQVEPFKKPLFDKISKNRSLIVMGYSGSDDFDVVPTLKVLENLKNVVWINFIPNDGGKEKIYEIDLSSIHNSEDIGKVDQILFDIRKFSTAEHVYRLDVNTTRMVKDIFENAPEVSKEEFSVDPFTWLKENIDEPDNENRYDIARGIYFDFGYYNDALRVALQGLKSSKESEDIGYETSITLNIGVIYETQGNFDKALEYYQKAIDLAEENDIIDTKSKALNNIGIIYKKESKYDEAIKYFNESLEIKERLEDFKGKAFTINGIGNVYLAQGKYDDAIDFYEQSLKLNEEYGNLSLMAVNLNNIGSVYKIKGDYNTAVSYNKQALKIRDELSDYRGMISSLKNIGSIYTDQQKFEESKEYLEKALTICDSLQDPAGFQSVYTSLGNLSYDLGNIQESIEYHKKALELSKELKDLQGQSRAIHNIGLDYLELEKYDIALEHFEKSLEIDESIGDSHGKANVFNNIGSIYSNKGENSKAIEYYKKALAIFNDLGVLRHELFTCNSIGNIYQNQGKYKEAL